MPFAARSCAADRIYAVCINQIRADRRGCGHHDPLVQDVGIDHGRRDIPVAQEFLDGSDIVAGVERVRRPERCGTNSAVAASRTGGVLECDSSWRGVVLPDGPDGRVDLAVLDCEVGLWGEGAAPAPSDASRADRGA